jgi:hypothetical protein
MAAAAPLAIPLAIAGAGLSAAGSMQQAQGQAQSYAAQAEAKQQQAYIGKIKATQVDSAYRDELSTTLANIDAIRAAAGASMTSPTGMAIKAREEEVSDRSRRTQVFNIMEQVYADRDAARLYEANAKTALTSGYMNAAGGILGAFGKIF